MGLKRNRNAALNNKGEEMRRVEEDIVNNDDERADRAEYDDQRARRGREGPTMEVVQSSDQEDEPWSPLGSPVKARYPAPPSLLSTSGGDPQIFKIGSAGEGVDRGGEIVPMGETEQGEDGHLQQQQDEGEEDREETQWESYWTTATPRIIPLEVGENDSLADMLRDSYESPS
jgi:hypothetical protein